MRVSCKLRRRFRLIFLTTMLGIPFLSGPNAIARGVSFSDVTASSGISVVHNSTVDTLIGSMSGGAAVGDFDGDGWPDLYVTRHDAQDSLYRNLHDGRFEDVYATAFANVPHHLQSNGPVWGDVDNDGDLDLYVTSWGGLQNNLFINDHGVFHEDAVTRHAAIDPGTVRTGMSATFGDYDGDGYLDLFSTEWTNHSPLPGHTRLLHNLGAARPGYFEDVTVSAGIDLGIPAFAFAPRFSDLDHDGQLDLAIASDFGTVKLYWNQGDGTFLDGTQAAGTTRDRSAMGSAIGDADNDGDLDWFIGDIDVHRNSLYVNQLEQGQARRFTEMAATAGVRQSGWTWGSSFIDADNDGWQDLIMTNGIPHEWDLDPIYLFRNQGTNEQGQIRFADISNAAFHPRDTRIGSGLVVFDYDLDGDQDVFIVNGGIHQESVLYRNDSDPTGSFLRINTVGTLSNRDGIGAWITVTPDSNHPEVRRVWEVNAGSNFLGQNEMTAHFGWEQRTATLDQVTIDWPSGQTQTWYEVPLNTTLTAIEPVPEPATMPFLWGGLFWAFHRGCRSRQHLPVISLGSKLLLVGLLALTCICPGLTEAAEILPCPLVASTRLVGPQFRDNPVGVTGADGATSLVLPQGDTLWVFGDTVEGPFQSIRHLELTSLRSNTGLITPIQDASNGIRNFRFLTTDDGTRPRQLIPFAPDENPQVHRVWGIHGTCVKEDLFLFYHRITLLAGVDVFVNFQLDGMGIARARSADLQFTRLTAPDGSREFWKRHEPTFGVYVEQTAKHCYLWGSLMTGMFLARVPLAQIDHLPAYEYLVAAPTVAHPEIVPRWSPAFAPTAPLFDGVPNEMSASFNPHLQKYVAIHAWGREGTIVMRTADSITGPWSDPQRIYQCQVDPQVDFVYAAKEHPEFARERGRILYVTFVNSQTYIPQLIEVVLRP